MNNFKTILIFIISALFIYGCNRNKEQHKRPNTNTTQNSSITNINCLGYIETSFTKNGSSHITIDTVQWLEGESAQKAIKEDNELNKVSDPGLPGGYYIRNSTIDSITVKISDSAKVIMQTLTHNSEGNYNFNQEITIHKFLTLLNQKDFERFRHKLYKFEIVNNVITEIQEKYIP